jgi:hypothetical protein
MSTEKISKVAVRQAEQKTLAIAVATSIYHYKWIAASVGITEDALKIWRDTDKDFSDRLDQARSQFINKNMRKARPDFLLETADRETFGRKQEVAVTGNAIQAIIDKYGGSEGVDEVPPITTTEERPPT